MAGSRVLLGLFTLSWPVVVWTQAPATADLDPVQSLARGDLSPFRFNREGYRAVSAVRRALPCPRGGPGESVPFLPQVFLGHAHFEHSGAFARTHPAFRGARVWLGARRLDSCDDPRVQRIARSIAAWFDAFEVAEHGDHPPDSNVTRMSMVPLAKRSSTTISPNGLVVLTSTANVTFSW